MWSDERWKVARRCGAKHMWKSKCAKNTMLGPLLEVEMSKKCTVLWREAHCEAQSVKNWRVRSTFGSWDVEKVHAVVARSTFRSQKCKKSGWTFRCRFAWQVQGIMHLIKSEQKREGFVAFPKRWQAWDLGHMQRIWQDVFRVAGAVQETCSSELFGGQGADFLRSVAFWSIRSSGLLRWFCVTGAALRMTWHHVFVAGAVV